ncbi:MAG: YggS family pyridoxal phosphate-dependent enzyme [Acidimicrobiia bacterium]|nr:YggS family pyridoxal phosphate-dependent enzyme [Acidimicrobiia bacterium]
MSALEEVRERVAAAAVRVGRHPGEITLVAVSKGASDASVALAYAAGIRDFGENRADGLAKRAPRLPPDIRWHFVGRLQGNKVTKVRTLVHLLHSLDRPDLARYWGSGGGPIPPALVEVNVAAEPNKAGVAPADAATLLAAAAGCGIEVRGLMTMAPLGASGEAARPYFAALRDLRNRLLPAHPGLRELSMGMTDDYETAVEEGATILRVGRAIFPSSPKEG